jgi:hypothetical protein
MDAQDPYMSILILSLLGTSIFPFIVVMGGNTLLYLHRLFQYMNSSPHPFSFISSPLIPGVVSTGIIFAFTYMCTHFTAWYSPSYPFSPTPPSLPLVPALLSWAGLMSSCSLILQEKKEKRVNEKHDILA